MTEYRNYEPRPLSFGDSDQLTIEWAEKAEKQLARDRADPAWQKDRSDPSELLVKEPEDRLWSLITLMDNFGNIVGVGNKQRDKVFSYLSEQSNTQMSVNVVGKEVVFSECELGSDASAEQEVAIISVDNIGTSEKWQQLVNEAAVAIIDEILIPEYELTEAKISEIRTASDSLPHVSAS